MVSTDGRKDGRTEGRTDTERYNIIPRHTLVAGYENLQKKNFFLKIGISIQSTHTHTSFMVTFSFNLMTIVCVIAKLFLLTTNDIIVHYNKIPI